MKVDRRRIQFLVLTLAVMLTFLGASSPLKPLVQRNERASGPAPAGCDESLAPAPSPRIEVAEIPAPQPRGEVVALTPPPSRSLRSELQDAQRALAGNDRPAFDRHLAAARSLLDGYPPGGERNAASDAVRVLEDAARVWDAQFVSPFFDEGSDAYARASRYPGYAEAVRRSMLTDDRDRRFYPASESRAFLTRIAGERLSRLGIRPVTQRADATSRRRSVESPTRRVTPKSTAKTAAAPGRTDAPATRRTADASSRTTPRRTPRTAPAATKKPTPATTIAAPSSPDPSTPVRIAAADPAPAAPQPSTPRVDEAASPAADVPPPPADPEPVVTETAAASAPEASASATQATTAAPETTSAPATTAAVPERRSVVVPALLILIGLGVLIVLFRASS
jgi:cell division septation protein DedD